MLAFILQKKAHIYGQGSMPKECWEEQESKRSFLPLPSSSVFPLLKNSAFEPSVRGYNHWGAQRVVIIIPSLKHKFPENSSILSK